MSRQEARMYAPNPTPTDDDAGDMQSPRVLIVDDNPTIHQDFRKILGGNREDRALGDLDALVASVLAPSSAPVSQSVVFQLDSAYQGQEALALVEDALKTNEPYALCFLDVRMPPGWDGVETLGHLWEVDPQLQVVLCTAYSDYSWRELFNRFGDNDRLLILKKPFEPVEVRQLAYAMSRKWHLTRLHERRISTLEHDVAEQASRLEDTSARLRQAVADKVRAEVELRSAQRLEALGRLAAGIGHELNNPLCYLLGNVEGAKLELADHRHLLPAEVGDELEDLLQSAMIGAERIAQIVRSIKLFGQPSAGTAESVDVGGILGRLVEDMAIELGDDVAMSADFEPAPAVLARVAELQQVFRALLENAVHATATQTEGLRQIRVQLRPDGDDGKHVLIQIVDTGSGISEDDLSKIFEPFFSTKPLDRGSGLGLSICYGIVKGLGGTIDVRSIEGRGTVVSVRLPAVPAGTFGTDGDGSTRAESAAGVKPAPGKAPRARVLVIDDDPFTLRSATQALLGHDVVCVDNGRDALALSMAESFDVMLCNIVMPGINGMDFYRLLRENRPGEEQRVLFITGGALLPDVQAFLDSIPNGRIDKPLDRPGLLRLVEAARDR
ncbi:response regulator [Haliangium sp.]|uniref:response regulator n=1 Tax=Haliangium sp. TaxID=2663208 RepID=UPI003D0960D4